MFSANLGLSLFGSAIVSAMLLGGCGGGGDSAIAVATPTAEGVYGGTLTGGRSNAFNLLVLENGEAWSMYGTQSATSFGVAGFVQGAGTSSNGSFTVSNGKDFGFSPAQAGSTSATYDATAKTISGTTGSVTFSGGPVAGSLYNYDTAASLSAISGAWSATGLTGESIALNVAASGAFTATSGLGCKFSGTVAPRASGKNVFNVSLTFGAAPCALAGQAATGIALVYPLASGRTQLLVAAVDSTRTYGAAAVGTR
jgi:hypothetical protein